MDIHSLVNRELGGGVNTPGTSPVPEGSNLPLSGTGQQPFHVPIVRPPDRPDGDRPPVIDPSPPSPI